jgi:hypothetical protein
MTESPTPTTRNILPRAHKRIVEDELLRLAAKPGFKDRTRADILAEIDAIADAGGFKVTMGNLEGAAKAMGVELPTSRPAPTPNEDRELLHRVARYIDVLVAFPQNEIDIAAENCEWRAFRRRTGGTLASEGATHDRG